MKYDLDKLPVGWYQSMTKGQIYQANGDYYYHVDSGRIDPTPSSLDKKDPEAAFQFHVAAREALKQCEADWKTDVGAAAGHLGFKEVSAGAVIHVGEFLVYCYSNRTVNVRARTSGWDLPAGELFTVLGALKARGFKTP